MQSSQTILRRFTPPTCTLEIWGKNSSLSRWAKQEVLKDISFKLSFDDPRIPEEQQVTILGDREKLETIYHLVLKYTENFLKKSFPSEAFSLSVLETTSDSSSDTPHLKSQGLASHELNLGSLAEKDTSEKQIQLSGLQLFDLVSALEEYKTQMAVLAEELNHTEKPRIFPLWGKVAAGLVIIGGLTAGVMQLIKEGKTPVTVSKEESQSPVDSTNVIPPQVPTIATNPTPNPQLREPLSSVKTLPPPPAVDTPKPPPDIPDPAKYPLSEVGKLVAPEIASSPITQPPTSNNSSEKPSTQVESKIVVSEQKKPDTTTANSTSLEIATNKPSGSNSSSTPALTQENGENPSAITEEKVEDTVTDNLSETASNTEEKVEDTLTDNPSETNSNTEETNNDNPDIIARNSETRIPEIPQLQEVETYFEKKWQPPSGLRQSLEYRLILNTNGSIKQVVPLGVASATFLDRTNIPLKGESFVSPLKNSNQATIRLILSPEGEVQTFLE